MGKAIRFLVLVALILVGAGAFIQYWMSGVTVPNLETLTIPQAESALNRAGLRLGNVNTVDEENNTGTPDTVVGQASPAFLRLPIGTAVDVTVLRTNNILLRYDVPPASETTGNNLDERWFNLINLTNEQLYIADLRFVSAQDENIALDDGNWRWSHDDVLSGQCLQLMPVNISFITPVECQPNLLRQSLPLTDDTLQFWIAGESFYVYQDDILRATCQVADDRCEFWIEEEEVSREIAEYFYFVYDQDRFAVFNRSADRWMPLAEVTINGNQNLGREDLEPLEFLRASDLNLLAPQQCILLTTGSEDAEPFPGCVQVIGQARGIDAFWRQEFRVSGTDCLAATDETTICVVPRG